MRKESLTLIVEDVSLNSELIEVLLERRELPYLVAIDGEEAMRIFIEHPEIDLVLLDIKLPKLWGEEVLIKMKALRPHVPIVVQTAYVFDEDRARFFRIGCDDYMAKPLNKRLFYKTISKWIDISL